MKVASKLRGVFALYIVLLAGVLIYHVRTVRRAAENGHQLTAISSRLRVSTGQLTRLSEMSSNAEKYLVTRDLDYLDGLGEVIRLYGVELSRLPSLELSDEERARLAPLNARWIGVEDELHHLVDAHVAPPAVAAAAVARLEDALDAVRAETARMGEAARAGMTRELAESERAAGAVERVSWLAAIGTLLIGLVLSALLVRSIAAPLERLTRGTREISAGRFGYRLDASGGDEFAHVARDFNAMATRLAELDQLKKDFVSNVSHDLKTPLSSMLETTRVMLDRLPGPISAQQRRLLELNLESGGRLSSMIGKLLDVSRLDSLPMAAVDEVDVARLVRDAVDRADAARSGGGTTVTLANGSADRMLLRVDAEGIARVLDNLLENAVKFSPPAGMVSVAVDAPTNGGVSVSIADEGPGIPDADRERVFERFYQTEVGRAVASRGVGLGLSICRQIVAGHGGTIRIADNVPRGSVFRVWLPGPVIAREGAAPAESGSLAGVAG